eukprot:TRINITY_DN4391_c0_g1_i1.p1 TRINITY_DN4391_c0_g1~~TRINITY_DN4391_c0_g1_i1.p1  ORF type:complete len:424 (+),score=152.07 TRINITY_DN4391_c0_g1_i1:160-1431(+)
MKLAVNTAKLLRNVPLPDEIQVVHDAAVVIDLGSGTIKVGFSGDDAPRHTVPCIEGTLHAGAAKRVQDKEMRDTDVCAMAYKRRDQLDIGYPIKKGLVQPEAWGDPLHDTKDRSKGAIERIFEHVYEHLLKTDPREQNQPLLLTEPALTDLTPAMKNREMMCEILFESVGIPSLYVAQTPVLSLYSSGRTTGMVIEAGFGLCHTAPIFEGYPLFHSILQLDFAGQELTDMVVKQLADQGCRFEKCHEKFIAEYLKETLCQVAEDRHAFEQSSSAQDDVETKLPDGTKVRLDGKRWSVAESLFDAQQLEKGDTTKGLHHLAHESVRKCDPDIGPTLYQNVCLAGGSSMFQGMPDRMHHELTEMVPSEKVKIFAATERKQAAWIGGSILASLPTFQDMWIKKEDYEEYGSHNPGQKRKIVHRNCF